MKLLFIIKSEKILNVPVVLLTYYTKSNNDILKNIMMDKFQESFMLMLEFIKFDNQQVQLFCEIKNFLQLNGVLNTSYIIKYSIRQVKIGL